MPVMVDKLTCKEKYDCIEIESKLKNITLFTLLLISHSSLASSKVEISILTCSPGQETFSIFGHTAIRIIDKENQTDKVYNFGMFDFNAPNFEYNYLKGKLEYFKGIQKTADFIEAYTYEKRLVLEQKLNLTEQEINELLKRLDFLYQPENQFYLYSFLGKNCSTEVRDLLVSIAVDFQNEQMEKSNRDLINAYLNGMPWLRLGINLLLGKSLDKNSSRFQSMFLPDYLNKEMNTSTLNGEKVVILEHVLNSFERDFTFNYQRIFSPLAVFSLSAILFLFWFPDSVRILTCFGIGITGLFILVLWLFSDHEEVKTNLNIIWCNPLYLLYIPSALKTKVKKVLITLAMISIVASILIWILKIQIFDIAIIPILIILGILNFKEIKNHNELKNTNE